jgi:hypothetical protein
MPRKPGPLAPPTAPSLRATQEWLAATILSSADTPAPACEWILERPAAGVIADRLAVHRVGYPARMHAAIADTYPAVAHLIGDRALHGLVLRYARALSRHSYNLNGVGAELPEFLASDPLTERLPFLPDLARMEERIASAFHAFELPAFDPQSLAGWALEDFTAARLTFQPSLAVVRSSWPIVVLWEARRTPVAEIDIDVRDRPESALVHRRGYEVACSAIDAAEADCLAALLLGETLGGVSVRLEGRAPAGAVASGW